MNTKKSIVECLSLVLLLTTVLISLKGVGADADFVQSSKSKSDGLCQIPFDDKSDVTFSLYTRKNQNTPELLEVKDGKVDSEYFNPKNKLKVLTHGWLENGSIQLLIQWLLDIKDAYLETEDLNVIVVDWNSFCEYIMASIHTSEVGKEIAELLDALHASYGMTGKDIHLIGHSLGAHVMGSAGKYSKQQRVSRITGLDPARPLFEVLYLNNKKYHRLQKSDAKFVDIIHTCAGLYGYVESIGHADFYPNGGDAPQPGCIPVISALVGCSHGRSHEFFRESINTKIGFYSYPCDDYDTFKDGKCKTNPQLMGAHLDPSSRGNFYLRTNAFPDYAQGKLT